MMLELEKRKLHRPHGFLWLFTFWVFLTFPTNFLPKDSNWFVSPKENLNLSHVTWFSSNVLLKFVKAESDNRMDFDAFSICHWWEGNESKYFRQIHLFFQHTLILFKRIGIFKVNMVIIKILNDFLIFNKDKSIQLEGLGSIIKMFLKKTYLTKDRFNWSNL